VLQSIYLPANGQGGISPVVGSLLRSAAVFPWMLDVVTWQRTEQLPALFRLCAEEYAGLNNLGDRYKYVDRARFANIVQTGQGHTRASASLLARVPEQYRLAGDLPVRLA
jgi:hypothetical protein